MAVTLDASTSAGLIQTADTSGVISLLNNGTAGLTLTSGNLQFNSGYGSVATAYGCRAWVSFAGSTGTMNASGNVSSITRNGTGDYTVNMTSAMPDANYSAVVSCRPNTAGAYGAGVALFATGTTGVAPTTSTFRFTTVSTGGATYDPGYVTAAVFR